MTLTIARIALLSLAASISAVALADGPALQLRGGHFANWWTLGEQVVFSDSGKSKGSLPEGSQIVGEVLDSEGAKLEEHAVPAGVFKSSGWSWTPKAPGFYQIKFSLRDAAGALSPLVESYNSKIYKRVNDVDKPKLAGERDFARDVHNVAVTAAPPREPSDVPAQVGVSLWLNRLGNADEIKVARLVGMNFLRVQMNWGRLEPKDGEYDWSYLDAYFAAAAANGFNDSILNPFGTPRWASSKPERNEMNICVWGWESFAPAKMDSWTEFLTTLVKRYPQVKEWELWNEPHLPGQSCFWQDSPESYVALLKAGYGAVKKAQPDSTVLLGGVGMRYLPFYERIVKLGATDYFDVLPLHGSWVSPEPFRRIDAQAGVASKPWVSSEWHAMLLSHQSAILPSEEALAKTMLIDFMNQLRLGAGKVSVFTMTNLYKVEKETLSFHKELNDFTHVSGFFRSCPYIEPRLQAFVWRNFIDLFSGSISYREGYSFASGFQRASLMRSAKGDVLLFWQAGKADASPIDPAILKAAGPGSELLDWEGHKLSPSASLMLHPEKICFLRNPNMDEVAKWTSKDQVLRQDRGKAPDLEHFRFGAYREGALFDSGLNVIAPESLKWQELGPYVSMNGKPMASGFSAKFAASFTESALELLVDVQDASHVQACSNYGGSWDGDGLQFAIDAASKGYPDDRLEVSAALTAAGPDMWKGKMPSVQGDIPVKSSPEGGSIKYGAIKIERTAKGLLYKIRIDKDDLYPFVYAKRQPMRFSILVNNNDGSGREGYLEWASGIGASKEPAQYGDLTVEIPSETVLRQQDLSRKWGAASISSDGFVAKVSSLAGDSQGPAAISPADFRLASGGRYVVSFKARGDVPLIGMLVFFSNGQEKGVRQDFLKSEQLGSEWRSFEIPFIVPANVEKASLSLLCWQRNGFFEIKDFALRAP